MTNEEHKVLAEEGTLTDEEMTDEDDVTDEEVTDEEVTNEEVTDEEVNDEDLTDEDEMTDEELTFIAGLQIALVGFLFGMAFMGILVYATTPMFKFFI